MQYIVDNSSEEALLEQLIEECGELIQVCAKRLRIKRNESPTPITLLQNEKNLIEELADVSLSARVLIHKDRLYAGVVIKQDEKLDRWRDRIHDAKEGNK